MSKCKPSRHTGHSKKKRNFEFFDVKEEEVEVTQYHLQGKGIKRSMSHISVASSSTSSEVSDYLTAHEADWENTSVQRFSYEASMFNPPTDILVVIDSVEEATVKVSINWLMSTLTDLSNSKIAPDLLINQADEGIDDNASTNEPFLRKWCRDWHRPCLDELC